jgi:glycosyltransferase involved in cell wall biosynthesis
MKKLAVVTTHPIQYNVPWLIKLAEKGIVIKVFYTYEQSRDGMIFDTGFGKDIKWDIPLLEGYEHEFVSNTARRPGLDHFMGIVNPQLTARIEAWRPDDLLVIGWNYSGHLQCMRYFHGRLPVYFRGDSVLLHEKSGFRRLARRIFLTWVYRHIDYAFYVGTNNRSYFLRHGLRPDQLVFSPQAIDLRRFSQPAEVYRQQAAAMKKELGIPEGRLTVLYAGKMTTVKNPGFMLRLAKACADLPVSFVLVGDGSLKDEMKRQAAGLSNMLFMDFQNQRIMPAIYRMGDVYIMPSLSETWGMGVNEAMACGLPVMASEHVGCVADLVLENKTGMTFQLDEIDKCVAFLRRLYHHRDELTEMGTCATSLIEFFSFSHIVDSVTRTMYSPAIESRRRSLISAAI